MPDGVLDLTVEYTPEQQAILDDIEEHSVPTKHGMVQPDPATLGYTPEDLEFLDQDAPYPSRLLPPQAEHAVVEADVRCKRELRVVQRLADLDAAVLEKYIADNPEYFRSVRDVTSTMLRNAVEVLDTAGVDVPDVGEVGAGASAGRRR
ncbi:hypothetical protein [Isoptericola sp. BMS4]|uniref:hypothetical protein n=1 Tax=Isoptericola sp. BMS4 TaxID=2527875 RepID=UPI0014243BAC|nr:hypothetical protein [Isoptericola sp. BMS4]